MANGLYSPVSNYICAALSFMGLAISVYALYVQHNLDNDINYQPVCDIAYYVSCSKTFRSPFAKGFGVTSFIFGADHTLTQKNPVYGCLFYTFIFLLQFIHCSWARKLSQILLVFANLLSIYLFFILIYLRTVCAVCVCNYVINALLLYFSFQKHPVLDHNSIYNKKRS
uniref:vitamin-K-epoxide reductase (warfarin-sensitive) n=1 Tax=Onchocerca volvulus TaxID=6282 RepID=A0A8R1Y0L0_ONCVO